MSKFKICLLIMNNDIDTSNLNSYSLNNRNSPNYIEEVLTDFESNINKNIENNTFYFNYQDKFNYTSNEEITFSKNSQNTLTFQMLKYNMINEMLVLNPYTEKITIGSQIRFYDKNNTLYDFTVKSIDYEIKKNNIIYKYSCQDSFTYKNIRQNNGYEILNDSNSENFIGAKSVDYWAQKITNDCKLNYEYLGCNYAIYNEFYQSVLQAGEQSFLLFSLSELNDYKYFIGKQLTTINTWEFRYSLDNITFDTLTVEQTDNSFNLTDNSSIICNIEFSTFNDENGYSWKIINKTNNSITIKIILPDNQLNSYYISTTENRIILFRDTLDPSYNKIITFSVSSSNAENALITLGEQAGLILEVNDKNQQFWFIPEKNENFSGTYYSPQTDIKSINVGQAGETLTSILNVAGPTINNSNITLLPSIPPVFLTLFSSENWNRSYYNNGYFKNWLKTHYVESIPFNSEDSLYPSDEMEFAKAADKIPWLENKIIDLSYFSKKTLLNKHQYEKLKDTVNNQLRIVNGKLLYWTTSYYNALVNKNKILSNLINQTDTCCADFYNCMIAHYNRTTTSDYGMYLSTSSLAYTDLNNLWSSNTTTDIIDINDTLTNYANKLFNAEQVFLKNIYAFVEYFNSTTGSDTNHKIYYDFKHLNSNSATAIAIDTQLTEYWTNAYTASCYCQWFIPEDWHIEDNNLINVITVENNDYILNTTFIPSVTKIQNDYYILKVTTDNTWTQYENNADLEFTDVTNPYINCFGVTTANSPNVNGYNISYLQNLRCQKQDYQKDYYYVTANGQKWDSLVGTLITDNNNLFWSKPSGSIIGGIYCIMFGYLTRYYTNLSMSEYESLLTSHNNIWQWLYDTYGPFLLEDSFTSDTATSSSELYEAAQNYFKDKSLPERSYDISIINTNSLYGLNNKNLKISDQIRINSSNFYEEEDDLKYILQQPLFVTDINYTLRKDDEVKLTVNTVKYQDKMIQKLVNLIR